MQIESKKKKLCLEPLRGIITQGEKMADTVIFRLPATYGALILSDLSWQIRAASEKNTLVTADLTASSGGEFCLVQWEVSADFTAVSGALSLMLVGTDSAGNVVIKFPGDDPIWVRDAETGQYSPPEDAIQKALNGLQQAESTLEDATKALQEIGINFKTLGHYGTLPELEAAVTNPSPGDAYGVGDPTVVYVWNGTSWAPLPGVFQPYPHNNLLVNPRFKYNSRSQQSYSSSSGDFFSLDGWAAQNAGGGTASVSANSGGGITLTTSALNQGIKQLVYKNKMPNGTYTISILVNGTVCSETFAFSGSDVVNSYAGQNFSYAVVSATSDTYAIFLLVEYLTTQQSYTITAAKLERGSVSTLQAELDNPPPEDVEKLKLDMYDLDPGRCAYLPWHNENLLDNWYFVGGGSQQGGGQFPINQRGQRSYTGTAVYGIDRWKLSQGTTETVNIESNGISISTLATFVQAFENLGLQNGETITLSAVIDGVLISGSTTYNASSSYISVVEADGFRLAIDPQNKYFQLFNSSGTSENLIQAVKLEKGYLSTLARKDESGNWVLNDPPPNFEQELAKCQRYYIALNGFGWIGSGQVDGGGVGGQFFIPLPVTMRKVVPTIAGNFRVYNSSNSIQVTNVVATGGSSNGINGGFSISGWNDSSGGPLYVWLNANEILGISADL